VIALSPYSLVRRKDDLLLLETPLGSASVLLHDPVCLSLVGHLASPIEVGILRSRIHRRLHGPSGDALLAALLGSGIAERVSPGAMSARAAAQCWDFHDLLFHSRSRDGWNPTASGATYRFRGKTRPAPAVKRPPQGDSIELPRPNERTPQPAYFDVLASRRSVRFGGRAIGLSDLGELLYYTARVRGIERARLGGKIASRPYPSGGACYELELYPVVGRCAGASPGIYYYDPLAHRLCPIAPGVAAMSPLEDARIASGARHLPDVLLVATARFRRVAWKYESIAYALVLKNVGVLLQTLSLTATALGLSACSLGNGNGKQFCSLARLDYLEESPVGEFMIVGLGGDHRR
jgi:SagB-type dehydrogenase family enzyme